MSKQPTTPTAPVTFDEFDAIYRAHLADPDTPSCYIAYCRAESDHEQSTGARRWKNYQTFVNTRTRRNREQKNGAASPSPAEALAKAGTKNTPHHHARTEIKCQLCPTTIATVPRGDLRTIIPQICGNCIEKIKNLIAPLP